MNWHLNDVSKLPEMEKIVVNALPQNVAMGMLHCSSTAVVAASFWPEADYSNSSNAHLLCPDRTLAFYSNTFISGMRLAVCGIISYFGVEEWF